MKKFLSILLALAVGFTFTFGSAMSAFAAAPSEANTELAKAYNDAMTALNTAKASVVLADATDNATPKNTIKAEYQQRILDAVYNAEANWLKATKAYFEGTEYTNDLKAAGFTNGKITTYYYEAADASITGAIKRGTENNEISLDTANAANKAYNDTIKGLDKVWAEKAFSENYIDKASVLADDVYYVVKKDVTITIRDYDEQFHICTAKELKKTVADVIANGEYSDGYTTEDDEAVVTALKEAYVAQFNEDKTTLLADAARTDISMYSENKQDNEITVKYNWNGTTGTDAVVAADKVYTYKKAAEKTIEAIKTAINGVIALESSDVNALKANFAALKNLAGNFAEVKKEEVVLKITFSDSVKGLVDSTTEANENSKDEAIKAGAKAKLAQDIAKVKTEKDVYKNASLEVKALLNDWMDAFRTATEWLIDNDKTYGTNYGSDKYDVQTIDFAKDAAENYSYTAGYDKEGEPIKVVVVNAKGNLNNTLILNVKEAARALADVDRVKAEKNDDGSLKYDSKKVDAALEAFLEEAYTGYTGTPKSYSEKIYADAEASYLSAAAKANYKNETAKKVDTTGDYNRYNNVEYYDLEWKDVETAITAYNAAIDAAATAKDATEAGKALDKAIAAIKTKAGVDLLFSGTLYKTFTNGQNDLKAYATYLNTGKTGDSKLVFVPDVAKDGVMKEYYAAKGVRTEAELTAAIAEVKTAMGSAKSIAEVKTAAAAIVAQIAALPAKTAITAADKEAVKAAYDAYDTFTDDYAEYAYLITNATTLTAAISAVKTAEAKAINAEYVKLPAVANVKITDRDAVDAVNALIVAYNETEMYNGAEYPYTVDALSAKIRTLEFDALEKAVYAVPAATKVALTDKAAIEAARTAYDAYVKYYVSDVTKSTTATELNSLNAFDKKIADAEAALAKLVEAEKWTADDAKAYVFDQTIKASSVKLSAKKVKVTANFDASKLVENGFTVEYKFYKSTKKSSGYKYTGVTKPADNATYTNTNAKKGKNYYKFKVVVKNADGTVILTTALKDCKYACRTIK